MPRLALVLALGAGLVACGGKKAKSAEPLVGWHGSEDWPGQCYHPPAFDQLGPGDRRVARQGVMDAMMSQWQGQRDDGVSFNPDRVTRLETVMLGEPELIEVVALENLEQCQRAMRSGGETAAWRKWLSTTPGRLTEGQCRFRPLDYQLFDYLDVANDWQIPAQMCKGDTVRIKGSSKDEYRISEEGPWINVAGDTAQPTLGTQLPCNIEGCYAGMLIMRFTGESGMETILPVGVEHTFVAPEHGLLEVRINDDTFFDNNYRTVGSIKHHASIEYQGK